MHTRTALPALLLMISGAGCSVVAPGGLASFEDHLVYQPFDNGADWNPRVLIKEDVSFQSADGVSLHGWYCPVENPRAVVLYAHGNGGNLAHRAPFYRLLTERLDVTVLAFDYRGYGKSEGQPSEAGLLADARAARHFLAHRAGVAESDIVLYGQSLGGGVMVDLAAKDGARGLILESTFASLPAVADHKLPLLGAAMHNQFNSLEKIGDYRGPTLIAHGTDDPLVPIKQAKRLYTAANEPKRFVSIPGAEHNWTPTLQYVIALGDFIEQLP
ncbi:MAG: alpha/beta hydrolase [Planctomycetaceae bacterium]|nr:alpha/beta hydrolase [Planctomycetaceae bacterium]